MPDSSLPSAGRARNRPAAFLYAALASAVAGGLTGAASPPTPTPTTAATTTPTVTLSPREEEALRRSTAVTLNYCRASFYRIQKCPTLRVLIDDWHRLHLAGKRASYAAEAVCALHYAFADHLDDAARDLDRATVVRALDALTRRRKRKGGDDKRKGTAMTGRTAAYASCTIGRRRSARRSSPGRGLGGWVALPRSAEAKPATTSVSN